VRSALRQLAVSMLAAGLTYLIGRLVGISVVH
jgi:VIT1/CCC1 family predicted Fe2+/Mn2+ transporter